jgi:hydroxymethylbilane synthase
LEKTEWVGERLEPKEFCPAAGQGALGIETRKDDVATIAAVAFLDDAETRFAVTVERAALAALGGGCQVPIGIHCRAVSGAEFGASANRYVEVFGVVADPRTGSAVRVLHREILGSIDPVELGRTVAKELMEAGAGPLLEAVSGDLR